MRMKALLVFCCSFCLPLHCAADVDYDEAANRYNPKACKYHPLPSTLDSHGYLQYNGETYVGDVFGIPDAMKEHAIAFTLEGKAIVTVSAEIHRDSLASISINLHKKSSGLAGAFSADRGRPAAAGSVTQGAGGASTKAFLTAEVGAEMSATLMELVFKVDSADLSYDEPGADSAWTKSSCFPVRLDLAVVPISRIWLHIPGNCPAVSSLPPTVAPTKLSDEGLKFSGSSSGQAAPQSFMFAFQNEGNWKPFERAIWSMTVTVPTRLHRFVRFLVKTSFRFITGPLQILLELFDAGTEPDSEALAPSCQMGCMGGTPVYNGMILDHAMPTGFTYKLWLLAGEPITLDEASTQCMEFDFEYDIQYEQRMTPFEIGPQSWMCTNSRLPTSFIQRTEHSTEDLEPGVVLGRHLHLRDWFGFPPDETDSLSHVIKLEVTENSLLRVSTHRSAVDIRLILTTWDDPVSPLCDTARLPGANERLEVFCPLSPGNYALGFYGDLPLGGVHPCDSFFVQMALKPAAVLQEAELCAGGEQTGVDFQVEESESTAWRRYSVALPPASGSSLRSQPVGSSTFVVKRGGPPTYLAAAIRSDYMAADLHLSVSNQGKHIANPRVSSVGYTEMLGPLSPGTYTVAVSHLPLPQRPLPWLRDLKLCAQFQMDVRLVERPSGGETGTDTWLCRASSERLPKHLIPFKGGSLLVDSEFFVPSSGKIATIVSAQSESVLKIHSAGLGADALIKVAAGARNPSDRNQWKSSLLLAEAHRDVFLHLKEAGQYTVLISVSEMADELPPCPTLKVHLVLEPVDLIPKCPWASKVGPFSASSRTQRQEAASDHLGDLLVDLMPREVGKAMGGSKPAETVWLSPEMKTELPLSVSSASVAVRFEMEVHPPWLPVTLELVPKGSKYTSSRANQARTTARLLEHRLLLMDEDVPRGEYAVVIRPLVESFEVLPSLLDSCAHVTIDSEVGVNDDVAGSALRAELLDIPDLLAVQTLPSSMNQVGLLSLPDVGVTATSVYKIDGLHAVPLRVTKDTLMRIVCEPADMSNTQMNVKVRTSGGSVVGSSDSNGHLLAVLPTGYYEVKFEGKGAFLVTMGIASMERLESDAHSVPRGGGGECLANPPALPVPSPSLGAPPKSEFDTGPVSVRLASSWTQRSGAIMETAVKVPAPAVLNIQLGSPFILDFVRIGVHVPEGLWVGEQRAQMNALRLEVPPGEYAIQISQPNPLPKDKIPKKLLDHCLAFSAQVSVSPLAKQAPGAASECISYGALPLPLDLSSPSGGSAVLGGPIDERGRLLIRSRVVISDMHDGRKKLFLSTKNRDLVMKIGVQLGVVSKTGGLSLHVKGPGNTILASDFDWSAAAGSWERIYRIPPHLDSVWLEFKHEHREAGETGCVVFHFTLQTLPFEEAHQMAGCQQTPLSMTHHENFMPRAPSRQQMIKPGGTIARTDTTLVAQPSEGFIGTVPLKLEHESFVSASVEYNFILSHMEMDIIRAKEANSASKTSLVFGEMDYVNPPTAPTNVRQWIAIVLPPGDYLLRVADDHWATQFEENPLAESHSNLPVAKDLGAPPLCFPMAFDVKVAPVMTAEGERDKDSEESFGSYSEVESDEEPAVLSVHPDPTVDLLYGQDLLLTVRLSSAPRGSESEVAKMITLRGRSSGVSLAPSEFVQSSSDAGLVWYLVWMGTDLQVLGGEGSLRVDPGLVSSSSGKPFRLPSPVVYKIPTDAPGPIGLGRMWTGTALAVQTSKAPAEQKAPNSLSELHKKVQQARKQGQTGEGGTGAVRMEGGGTGVVVHEDAHGQDRLPMPDWRDMDKHAAGSGAEQQAETAGVKSAAASVPPPAPPQQPQWARRPPSEAGEDGRLRGGEGEGKGAGGEEDCGPGAVWNRAAGFCMAVETDAGPHVGWLMLITLVGLLGLLVAWQMSTKRRREGRGGAQGGVLGSRPFSLGGGGQGGARARRRDSRGGYQQLSAEENFGLVDTDDDDAEGVELR